MTHDTKLVIKTINSPQQSSGVMKEYQAPDLIVGYEDGYRSSWQTAVGGAPAGKVIEANFNKWSRDHCCDPEIVPAIFITNDKTIGKKLQATDICPAILDYLT